MFFHRLPAREGVYPGRLMPKAGSRIALLVLVVFVAVLAACAKKPTMKVHHAEVSGVQFGFPPQLAVQMTVVLDVYNPNSYDVAVRAMRGTVTFHEKYTVPIDFRAPGEGVWLTSKATTQVRVPQAVPIDLALRITREAITGTVPYRVVGKADVTATRSFKIESDDYSVDEKGEIARSVIEQSIMSIGIPILH
jgi:hypothetical protein